MINLLDESIKILTGAGFATERVLLGEHEAVIFESDTTLGFLFAYDDAQNLIAAWESEAERAIYRYSFSLKRAGLKAWNSYLVLLAGGETEYATTATLSTIEENLVGTRKIARNGVRDIADLQNALLTLLPLQSAPRLESVDLFLEIRQRTTELYPRGVDAFLSDVDPSVVLQVLEEGS
jgi:hypothetical protein